MKFYNSLPNKPLFLFSTLLVIFLGLISVWTSSASFDRNQKKRLWAIDSSNNRALKIQNRTKLFTVVHARIQDDMIEIELKNDYDKPVTSFQVYVGDTTTQVELMANGMTEVIPPGGIIHTTYPTHDELNTRGIIILAVLFDDQTGDGDPKYLYNLLQYREGMRIQRKHAMKLLEEVLNSSDTNLPIEVEKIVSNISPISDDEIKRLPMNVRLGIKDEQKRLMQRIHNLLHSDHFQAQEMKADKADHSKINNRKELKTIIENYRYSMRKL